MAARGARGSAQLPGAGARTGDDAGYRARTWGVRVRARSGLSGLHVPELSDPGILLRENPLASGETPGERRPARGRKRRINDGEAWRRGRSDLAGEAAPPVEGHVAGPRIVGERQREQARIAIGQRSDACDSVEAFQRRIGVAATGMSHRDVPCIDSEAVKDGRDPARAHAVAPRSLNA